MLTCFPLSAGIPVRGERVTEVRWQELLQMCKGQGEPATDIVSGFTRAGIASSAYFWVLSSLCVRKDAGVTALAPWGMLSPCMSVHKIEGRDARPVLQSWADLDSKGFWVTPIPIYFHVT